MKSAPPKGVLIGLALGVVYLVWGSTYLAIRVVVRQAPPVTSMGLRFVAAALVVGAVLAIRRGWSELRVTPRELLGCAVMGLLLPLLGNALVAVGEAHGTPSGTAALLIATTPLMITLYGVSAGERTSRLTAFGLVLGIVGVGWLVFAGSSHASLPVGPSLIVLFACASWGFGSWLQPRLRLPANPFTLAVFEMFTGGVMMIIVGLVAGERLSPGQFSANTWFAWLYLIFVGSAIGFSAYVWLLSNAPISLVSTYAYVNPIVAVILGALILNERVTSAVLVGGAIIVAAVATVITSARRPVPSLEAGEPEVASSAAHE